MNVDKLNSSYNVVKKENGKLKANFRLYYNKTSSGYGNEMDTWIKEDKMEQNERKRRVKW